MIVLDTDVVSEPMKPNGDRVVQAWLDRQVAQTLFLTATSLSELLLGIDLLPDSKRKKGLSGALSELLFGLFESRILPFDRKAATAYAPMVGGIRRVGCHISVADAQIAAIATVHGFSVATRDITPFIAAGVRVINPWED